MGSLLSSEPSKEVKYDLIKELRKKKMADIAESVEVINSSYPSKLTLNSEDFQDVFGSLLDDPDLHFIQLENTHNLNACVDIYEALSVFVFFSGESFENKLKFNFGLFDFDNSGKIEEKEMVMTLQSSVRGLCKYVNLTVPTLKEIEVFAKKIFKDVDQDNSGAIDYEEFQKWVKNNYHLQDFLLKFANTQTHENALRRTAEFLRKFRDIYFKIAKSEKEIKAEEFIPRIREELADHDEEGRNLFIEVLTECSNEIRNTRDGKVILFDAYEHVIRAMAAFSATDINNDHKVNRDELRFLLYCFEDGDDPDSTRIEFEMKQLDKDNSGFITRKEWLNYLCTIPANTGKSIFRSNLRKLFEKHDKDNSGYLSFNELKELIKEQFRGLEIRARVKGSEKVKEFETHISNFTQEVQGYLNQDADRMITWLEFKNYMEKCLISQNQLTKFLEDIL